MSLLQIFRILVKKPPTPQQQLDDSKKDKDPKLPDGRDKS